MILVIILNVLKRKRGNMRRDNIVNLNQNLSPVFQSYNLHNFRRIKQLQNFDTETLFEIEVVGNVLPFKVNNYVVDYLIDWDKAPDDPIYTLTFPQKDMLEKKDFETIANALKNKKSKEEINKLANEIRLRLNPHPAGQLEHNTPTFQNKKLNGLQRKYIETVLIFPKNGQSCHAYCTFCFRWPQFSGLEHLKFASKEFENDIAFIEQNKDLTDILITGGDPMIMNFKVFSNYINAILESDTSHIKTIRIGTKVLAYWPYKFTNDKEADDFLNLFEKVIKSGKQLAFMAHFTHFRELETDIVRKAIKRILNTGAVIRTQSPVIKHINDDPIIWERMLKEQVQLGCVPYYMFIARNTGAHNFFNVPLVKAWQIFRNAYKNISGTARTIRGPVMSCIYGKIQMLGVANTEKNKVMVLRFIQGRNPDWVQQPFFADYNPDAVWFNDLEPAFGMEKFFFQ